MFSLDGKFAVVSGALGRLGPVWVGALRGAGATVVGFDVHGGADAQVDVTSLSSVIKFADEHGAPDILVNNAAIDSPPGSHLTDSSTMLEVNVIGVMNCCDYIGVRAGGSIINIASLYSVIAPAWAKDPTYSASKAAVVAYTRQLAVRLAPQGTRVNALSPGGVLSAQPPDFVQRYCERTPMGRMATPEDLVGPLLFLASDASRYMTGQNVIVDGGYSSW